MNKRNIVTEEHLEAYRQHIVKDYCGWNDDCGFSRSPIGLSVEFEPGSKYIRVITMNGSSRSAHSFVEKSTGLIWKAASWKAPAKNFSCGAVLPTASRLGEHDFSRVRWTGVV